MTEDKISYEEFFARAIIKLRDLDRSRGIHSVYSGINDAFRQYYNEDPVAVTQELNRLGKIEIQPRKGGVMIYLPGEGPRGASAEAILHAILAKEDDLASQPGNNQYSFIKNGTDIIPTVSIAGYGELIIDNGSGKDAAVKLMRGSTVVRYVYIKRNSKCTIGGISAGTYTTHFAFGFDWDKKKKEFRREQSSKNFDNHFEFEETDTEHTVYTITLHPFNRDTAKTKMIYVPRI